MSVEQVEVIIPSNPETLTKLKNGIKEMSNSLTRKQSETDYFNESAKHLSEEMDIPVKFIKRMATELNKGTFDKKVSEEEQYQLLYETVTNQNND